MRVLLQFVLAAYVVAGYSNAVVYCPLLSATARA
jgi:hypothetical protein